jgi:LysR family glycine cleavage system transcriptional activator
MNWADLPSLTGLRAFAALAETGSYSGAAAALKVTHAAISQQIKSLEGRLGVTLVVRAGRGMALTDDGEVLARHLATGLAAICEGVEALTDSATARPVQVTMSPAFAVSWLMPRIMDFQQQHPSIMLMLNPTAQMIDPAPGAVDVAIRYGHGEWPGMDVTPFLLTDMVVVGARDLVGERRAVAPTMLVHMPWLQELGTNEVAEWMDRHHVRPERPLMITHMPGNLVMDAVRRGDGLTYTARCLVHREIQSGLLVELSSEKAAGRYNIVTRSGVLRAPAKAFVKWLKRQVGPEI